LVAVAACHHGSAPEKNTAEPAALPQQLNDPAIFALIDRVKSSNGTDQGAAAALKQQVGHQHVSLLIDQLNINYPGPEGILIAALERVVTAGDKALILDGFRSKLSLIHEIRRFHWEPDAKDLLVQHLDGNSRYVPLECIDALVSLKDPSTYPALKSYFINGWNHAATYRAIELLPGMDLDQELPAAWEKSVSGSDKLDAAYLCPAMLERGSKPAMEFLMEQLRAPSPYIPSTVLDPEMLSTRFLDHSGDAKERLRWWDENHDRIGYDPARRKFALLL
jgi:hypothetical protein